MPFQCTRAKLVLREDERKTLETIAKSRTESKGRVDRARMILEYHSGATISAIARNHKTNRPKVELQINKALQMGALPSLNDMPRPGRTATITDEAKAWLISLACTKPLDLGYSHELWTTDLLAKHARKNCETNGHSCLKLLSRGTVSKYYRLMR